LQQGKGSDLARKPTLWCPGAPGGGAPCRLRP